MSVGAWRDYLGTVADMGQFARITCTCGASVYTEEERDPADATCRFCGRQYRVERSVRVYVREEEPRD